MGDRRKFGSLGFPLTDSVGSQQTSKAKYKDGAKGSGWNEIHRNPGKTGKPEPHKFLHIVCERSMSTLVIVLTYKQLITAAVMK